MQLRVYGLGFARTEIISYSSLWCEDSLVRSTEGGRDLLGSLLVLSEE